MSETPSAETGSAPEKKTSKPFKYGLLTAKEVGDVEQKLAQNVSLIELAALAPLIGLEVTKIEGDTIVFEGETDEGKDEDTFTLSQYRTILEEIVEASNEEIENEKRGRNGDVPKGKRYFLPSKELPGFIEDLLKNLPEDAKVSDEYIPEETMLAIRSLGGLYSSARVIKNSDGLRMIEYGLPDLELVNIMSHEEAVNLLRSYLKTGKKPQLPTVRRKALPSLIEKLIEPIPEGTLVGNAWIPNGTLIAMRSMGGEYRNATTIQEDGIPKIRFGLKGKEKFLTHDDAINIMRNYVKRAKYLASPEAKKIKLEAEARAATPLQIGMEVKKEATDTAPTDQGITAIEKKPTEDRTMEEYRAIEEERQARATQLRNLYSQKHPIENISVSQDTGNDSLTAEEAMDDVRQKTRRELEGIAVENFDHRFTEQFHITEEELKTIDGFGQLSVPQQKLLFENLSQSVFGEIKNKANEQYKKDAADRQKEMQDSGFTRKAWAGITEALTKDFRVLSVEKNIGKNLKEAGFDEHKELLEFLVKSMARSGPRVHEAPNGELLVDVVNVREWPKGAERKFQKLAVRELNEAAHTFAKIPPAWKEEGVGTEDGKNKEWSIVSFVKGKVSTERRHGNVYNEKEAAYENAKAEFAESLRRDGADETEILQKLIEVDTQVKRLQFLQTSPDAVKELGSIEDKSVWLGAARSLLTSDGTAYFALGFAARSLIGPLTGFIGAPVISTTIAGLKSWNKTGAELRERDRLARMGVVDTSTEALNMVTAESLIHKTQMLLKASYEKLGQLEQNHNDALTHGSVEALDDIEKERRQVLGRLQARVQYIEDKEGLQRIQYGSGKDSYTKHAHLLSLLGEAAILLEENKASKGNQTIERLNRLLEKNEEKIKQSRIAYREKDRKSQMVKSLGMAFGFSVAGAAVAHFAEMYVHSHTTPQAHGSEKPPLTREAGGRVTEASPAPAPAPAASSPVPEQSPVPKAENPSGTPPISTETPTDSTPETQREIAPSSNPQPQNVPNSGRETIPTQDTSSEIKSYEIQKGDTLTKILRTKMPQFILLDGSKAEDVAIANFLKSLTPEEMSRIGIVSGDVDKIQAGAELNFTELEKILDEKKSIIENAETRFAGVPITSEDTGDFKGAQHEIDSDLVSKESGIREHENFRSSASVEITDDSVSESIKTREFENVDSITEQKAKILETYYVRKYIPPEYWKGVKNMEARSYMRALLAHNNEAPPALKAVFQNLDKAPLEIKPRAGETMEKLMIRIFKKITVLSEGETDVPKVLKEVFKNLEKGRKMV